MEMVALVFLFCFAFFREGVRGAIFILKDLRCAKSTQPKLYSTKHYLCEMTYKIEYPGHVSSGNTTNSVFLGIHNTQHVFKALESPAERKLI